MQVELTEREIEMLRDAIDFYLTDDGDGDVLTHWLVARLYGELLEKLGGWLTEGFGE